MACCGRINYQTTSKCRWSLAYGVASSLFRIWQGCGRLGGGLVPGALFRKARCAVDTGGPDAELAEIQCDLYGDSPPVLLPNQLR